MTWWPWTPTSWAVLTAISIVAAGRPRLRARAPRPRPDASCDTEASSRRWRRSAPSPAARATAFAVWSDGVARALRSGVSLADALDEAGGPDPRAVDPADRATVTELAAAVRRGAPLPATDVGSGELALVVSVIAACLEHGGPAAEPIDRAAGVLRARAAEAADRVTQSTQARLSAQVMTVLPLGLLLLLLATSASVRAAVTTTAGASAIALGVALNVIGWRWQRHLLRRAAT